MTDFRIGDKVTAVFESGAMLDGVITGFNLNLGLVEVTEPNGISYWLDEDNLTID